jgi:hypothetical protein
MRNDLKLIFKALKEGQITEEGAVDNLLAMFYFYQELTEIEKLMLENRETND